MNKILVKIFFPRIDKQYEIWIPSDKKIYNVVNLLIRGVNELNDNVYQANELPILYNKKTGEHYNLNAIICETNIGNGTELIIM